jgi:hypothetical protein
MPKGDGGSSQTWVKAVPREREPLAAKWDRGENDPTPEQLAVLRHIGATPTEGTGFGSRTVAVPCAARLGTGELRDPALYLFSRHPPIDAHMTQIAWPDEVVAVEHSRFALTQAVRIAASRAPEIRMAFRPLPVRAADGTDFTLDAPEDFFDVPGVDPKGVRVRPWSRHGGLRGPVVRMPTERITYVIGDWKPEYEALRLPVS